MPCCGSPAKLWPDLAQHPSRYVQHMKGHKSHRGSGSMADLQAYEESSPVGELHPLQHLIFALPMRAISPAKISSLDTADSLTWRGALCTRSDCVQKWIVDRVSYQSRKPTSSRSSHCNISYVKAYAAQANGARALSKRTFPASTDSGIATQIPW
jgi:hypothetical protein